MNEWIRLQEQMLSVHRMQLDAARQMAEAASHGIQLQKNMMSAAHSGARAFDSWISLWGGGSRGRKR